MFHTTRSAPILILFANLASFSVSIERRVSFPNATGFCSAPYGNLEPEFLLCAELTDRVLAVEEFRVSVTGVTDSIPQTRNQESSQLKILIRENNYTDRFPFFVKFEMNNKDVIPLGRENNSYLCLGYQSAGDCSIDIQPPVVDSVNVRLRSYGSDDILGLSFSYYFDPPELRSLQRWDFILYRFIRTRRQRSENIDPEEGKVHL